MDKKIITFLSQWRVIIPLAVIVLVWFAWPQPKALVKKPLTINNVSSTSSTTQKEVSLTSLFGVNKKLKCSIATATAYIDDTKVAATITENKKESRVIFDGDCLYRWVNGARGGDRSCGLKSYLPFVSQFANNDSIKKLYPQAGELSSACKTVSVIEEKVFMVPKEVLFKNKKLF